MPKKRIPTIEELKIIEEMNKDKTNIYIKKTKTEQKSITIVNKIKMFV